MTDERISDERLREKLYSAEIAEAGYRRNGLGVEAKIWSEDVSLLRELLSLRASHAELVKALKDVEWRGCYPRGCEPPNECPYCDNGPKQGHSKTCAVYNALENAKGVSR